jgi:hypothetical protein
MTRGAGPSGPVLRCPGRGKGHAAILYEPARKRIIEMAAYGAPLGADYSGQGAAASDDFVQAEARVAEARAALDEAEAMVGVSLPAGSIQRAGLQEAEDALASLDRPEGAPMFTAPEEIEALPVPEQRRVLRSIFSKVVLLKAGGKPEDRLAFHYTDGSSVYPRVAA